MGQRVVIIPYGGHVPVLDQREVQVSVERFLHGHHVLDIRDRLDADLLALFHHLGLVDDHHLEAASCEKQVLCSCLLSTIFGVCGTLGGSESVLQVLRRLH